MRTISKKTTKLFQTLTTIIMIAGLLFPPTTFAYAQDVVPPAPEAEQTAEPPSDAVELPVEQTVEPPADPAPVDPTTIELPAEQTVEAPTEAAPTEVFPLEQTVEVPAGLPTDQPAADGGAEEEAAPVESLAEIVEVLNETNTVLVDENDNEIPLASEDAAEVLEGADPFFKSGSLYIGYTSVGGTCPSFISAGECHKVANPVTEALGDTRLTDSTTLYIEGTTSGKLYNESVTISKAINLQAGRNFTKSSGNINYDLATAIINQITLAANLGEKLITYIPTASL